MTLTGFLVIFVKKIQLLKGPIHLIPNLHKNRVSNTNQLQLGDQNENGSRAIQQQTFDEFLANETVKATVNHKNDQSQFVNSLQHGDNLISIVLVFILIGILCLYMFAMYFAQLYELVTAQNYPRHGYAFQSSISVLLPTLYFLFNPRHFMIAVKRLLQRFQ